MLVAVRIADALDAKGISQKRFAKMTGRSESEISEWLSGNRNFTIDTLSDIKACLGLDLLNITAMRMVPVSKDVPRVKVARSRTPAVYDRSDVLTSGILTGWLPASRLELSIAL